MVVDGLSDLFAMMAFRLLPFLEPSTIDGWIDRPLGWFVDDSAGFKRPKPVAIGERFHDSVQSLLVLEFVVGPIDISGFDDLVGLAQNVTGNPPDIGTVFIASAEIVRIDADRVW